MPPENAARMYKELSRFERMFRDVNSFFEARPAYHQYEYNTASRLLCSFLALELSKELDQLLVDKNESFEWSAI